MTVRYHSLVSSNQVLVATWAASGRAAHANIFVTSWGDAHAGGDEREERLYCCCQRAHSHKRAVSRRFGMNGLDQTGVSGGV